MRSLPSFLGTLVFVYFSIYRAKLDVGTVVAVVLGLTVYHSAKAAEVVRAGIQSIDKGQVEAARSLGLTFMYDAAQCRAAAGVPPHAAAARERAGPSASRTRRSVRSWA